DSFLYAAPSLKDVEKLYRCVAPKTSSQNENQQGRIMNWINAWLETYTWPSNSFEQDILSLIELLKEPVLNQRYSIVSDLTLSRILDSRHFYCPMQLGLRFLFAALEATNWDSR